LGTGSNVCHQGAARESDDPGVVAATMANPGIILKPPVGSTGPFREHAELPDNLSAAENRRKTCASRKAGNLSRRAASCNRRRKRLRGFRPRLSGLRSRRSRKDRKPRPRGEKEAVQRPHAPLARPRSGRLRTTLRQNERRPCPCACSATEIAPPPKPPWPPPPKPPPPRARTGEPKASKATNAAATRLVRSLLVIGRSAMSCAKISPRGRSDESTAASPSTYKCASF
jgi:hypothetical protein